MSDHEFFIFIQGALGAYIFNYLFEKVMSYSNIRRNEISCFSKKDLKYLEKVHNFIFNLRASLERKNKKEDLKTLKKLQESIDSIMISVMRTDQASVHVKGF